MCVLYLLELVICTMPFIQDTKVNADGLVTVASPFNMFMMLFGVTSNVDGSFAAFSVVCVVLILIPIINFLFCAGQGAQSQKHRVGHQLLYGGVSDFVVHSEAEYLHRLHRRYYGLCADHVHHLHRHGDALVKGRRG